MTTPTPASSPIEGRWLRLRPVAEPDLPTILEWLREPEVLHWWDNELAGLDEVRREFLEPDPRYPGLGYLIEEGGRPLGYIQWWQRSEDDMDAHWAGIDIFIADPSARGRGVGTEAVRMLLAWLFEERHLHRVTIDPETGNARAIRSYQKAGFRLDGVLRHNDFMRGGWVDTQMLSSSKTNGPRRKPPGTPSGAAR